MECPKCHGKGEICKVDISTILDFGNVSSDEWIECPRCDGTGEIDEEDADDDD